MTLKNTLPFFLILAFSLSACAGTEIFSREYREQATFLAVFGVRNCPENEYVLVYQKSDTAQGWKMQNEYYCKSRGARSLDGKIYTKEQLKLAEEQDNFTTTIFYP
ncbi:MAG: hypothetical protein AAF569_08580 [Pseudomonadota bacterium]